MHHKDRQNSDFHKSDKKNIKLPERVSQIRRFKETFSTLRNKHKDGEFEDEKGGWIPESKF